MIRDILEKAGYKTGLLGTIDYEIGNEKTMVATLRYYSHGGMPMNAVGINVSKGKRLKQFNLSTIPKKSAQEQAP